MEKMMKSRVTRILDRENEAILRRHRHTGVVVLFKNNSTREGTVISGDSKEFPVGHFADDWTWFNSEGLGWETLSKGTQVILEQE